MRSLAAHSEGGAVITQRIMAVPLGYFREFSRIKLTVVKLE
jgi:hypothetical protein